MKKKLVIVLTLVLTMLGANNGMVVRASEDDPAFLITDEYVIIEHVRYAIDNKKVNYNELEYEQIDKNLFVAYDAEGIPNAFSLPLEENRIKDKERIRELDNLVGISSDGTRALPSSTVNPPYTRTLSSTQWSVTTPAVNVNVPGGNFYRVLSLKITGLAWNASKVFSVHGIYGDISGNWYDLPKFLNHSFATNNTVKWQNFTSTRYAILTFGNLAGETGYTYTVNRSAI